MWKTARLIDFIKVFVVVAFSLAVLFMPKEKKKIKTAVLQRRSFALSCANLKPNNISLCNSAPLTAETSYKVTHSFLLQQLKIHDAKVS